MQGIELVGRGEQRRTGQRMLAAKVLKDNKRMLLFVGVKKVVGLILIISCPGLVKSSALAPMKIPSC